MLSPCWLTSLHTLLTTTTEGYRAAALQIKEVNKHPAFHFKYDASNCRWHTFSHHFSDMLPSTSLLDWLPHVLTICMHWLPQGWWFKWNCLFCKLNFLAQSTDEDFVLQWGTNVRKMGEYTVENDSFCTKTYSEVILRITEHWQSVTVKLR